MLVLRNISYKQSNNDLLFNGVNLTLNDHEKTALIGNNGAGKSTLLKIIAGELQPSGGQININIKPYFVPQVFGQFNHLTIAQALRVDCKLNALKKILEGKTDEENFNLLNNDWAVEDRCKVALDDWDLGQADLFQKTGSLSGGQKVKIFLAGISIHQPGMVLLDEPTNHLDSSGRQLLYDYVKSTKGTLIVVSHDRKLLNLLDSVSELGKNGIRNYGGNYDFYKGQKQIENESLNQGIQSAEKALRKAREIERETIKRQQKSDSRGKRKQEKAGVARIMMNTLRNKAENSTAKLKSVHSEKISGISQDLRALRTSLPGIDKMKLMFDNSELHRTKVLFRATEVNFAYTTQPLWKNNLSFQISSGERIVLSGENGTGKTTLIKLILSEIKPKTGTVHCAYAKAFCIDQDYSLLDDKMNVYEQVQQFNFSSLPEHEIKIRLSRFLFTKDDWDKICGTLSGGERMRLSLCCLTVTNDSPDLIVFDEPTNNLDIQNVEILTNAINGYQGTIVVVSHDETFLEQINIERSIEL